MDRIGLRPYLQLVRAGTLFSPGADVLAGACLLAGAGGLVGPIWTWTLARMMVASVLLYTAGMVLNDHADQAVDREQRPERPIPRGEISSRRALLLGVACLVGSLLTSPVPFHHGIMALLVVGYDYVIKSQAFAGALTMGTLRGMNLLVPAAAVTGGFRVDGAIEAAAGYFLYIVAVTLLGILEDAERVKRRSVLGLIAIPPVVVVLVIQSLPSRWPATAIAIALAGLFLWRHRNVEWSRGTIRGAMMWLLLGTMLYTSLIAMGSGHWLESLVIVAMLVAARFVARRISLT